MRINRIEIGAFGKLKNFSFDFCEDFSLVFGENEDGKTTVMSFIKAMFYGTGKKTQQISESFRTKYEPWDGSPMAGRIYFTDNGTDYCLERHFRKSDSTDKIILTNTLTGAVIPCDSAPGVKIFKMGAAAFERCMYITSCPFSKDESASGELNSRLSSLSLTDDRNISSQKALERLDSAANKIISKSGKSGSYAKLISEIDRLGAELKESQIAAKVRFEATARLNENKEKYNKKLDEYKTVRAVTEKENDIRNAEKLKSLIAEYEKLEETDKSLALSGGGIANQMFVNAVKLGIGKAEKKQSEAKELESRLDTVYSLGDNESPETIEEKCKVLNTEIKNLEERCAQLSEKTVFLRSKLSGGENVTPPETKGVNPVLLIIGIIITLLGIAGVIINPLITLSSVAGIVLIVLSFLIKSGNTKAQEKLKSEQDAINLQLDNCLNEQKNLQEEINRKRNVLAKLSNLQTNLGLASKLKEKTEQAKAAEKAAVDEVLDYYKKYKSLTNIEELSSDLGELEKLLTFKKEIKQRIDYLCEDLGSITKEEAKNRLNAVAQDEITVSSAEITHAREREKELFEELSELKDLIASDNAELKSKQGISKNPETTEKELNAAKQAALSQKKYYDALTLAKDVLTETVTQVGKSYGNTLNEGMLKIFSRLTNGGYDMINASKSLDITVQKSGIFGLHEVDYLSAGTVDQAYLSMRLALAELISKENPIPVIIDDALDRYDDPRLLSALKFLKEYSADTQIIFFTCHNAVTKAAQEIGVSCKNLSRNKTEE